MKKLFITILLLLLSVPAFSALTPGNVPRTKTGGAVPSLMDSQITDNGTNVGISTNTPTSKLEVKGGGIKGELVNKTWETISQDSGLTSSGVTFAEVNSMAVYKGDLYLGYNVDSNYPFTQSNAKVYKWDGNTLTAKATIGTGADFTGVAFLQEYKGNLYAGIQGTNAGDGDVYVSTDSGTTWSKSYDDASSFFAYCATIFKGNMYVGNGYTTGSIKKYDGSSWTTAYAGLAGSGLVVSLGTYQGRIFAAAGGTNAAILSSTDGSSWSTEYTVASSTYLEVNHFIEFNGKLYANVFTNTTNDILVRNNSTGTWSVSATLPSGSQAWGMNVYNGVLYVGSTESPNGAKIYKSLDGVTFTLDTQFNTLGTSFDYEAFKMINYNGSLYVGTGGNGLLSANLWRKTDSTGQLADTNSKFTKYMRFNNSSYNYGNDQSSMGISLPLTVDSSLSVGSTLGVGIADPTTINAGYLAGVYNSSNSSRSMFVDNPNAGTLAQARFELKTSDANGEMIQYPTNGVIPNFAGRTILYNETGNGVGISAATGDITFLTGTTSKQMFLNSSGLEVDGNLKVTGIIDGGLPALTASTYVAMGDSITLGTGASVPATGGYAPLLAADMGSTLSNLGVSGEFACDLANVQAFIQNPSAAKNNIYTVMVGTNEANTKGTGAYEVNYNNCLKASLSWLGIPSTYKSTAQSASCSTTGSWSNDSSYGGAIAKVSTTNGSTMTCTITTYGGPVYAWYKMADSLPGTFNISIDGGATTAVQTSPTTAIAAQGTQGDGVIEFSHLSAGSHSVLFTVTSATSGSNPVVPIAIGTPSPLTYYMQPSVYVGGVIKFQNDASPTLSSTYNADALAIVNALALDGLKIYYVDTRSYLNASTEYSDAYHPNDTGHGHLRDAFEAKMQFYPRTSGGVTGTLTNHYIPVATSSSTLGDSTIYNNSGSLGIGTTTSTYPLEIKSATNLQLKITGSSSTGYNQTVLENNTGKSFYVGMAGSSEVTFGVADKFYIYDLGNNAMRMVIDQSGRMGVANVSPAAFIDSPSSNRLGNLRLVTGAVVTNSGASLTLTGANMSKNAIFQETGTTAATFTLDTGTNLSSAVSGVAVGDMVSFVVSNASTQTITMAGATGTTLANAMTVLTLQSRTFYAINTGANTWTIY